MKNKTAYAARIVLLYILCVLVLAAVSSFVITYSIQPGLALMGVR